MYKNLPNYLSYKDKSLYYKNINLMDLVNKYGTPLEVAYTDLINEKIQYLQSLFNSSIKKYKYKGNYHYAYATKANYYSEVVSTALNHANMLETSSGYDMDMIEKLYIDKLIPKGYTIICNGFKKGYYFEKIIKLKKMGLNIIPVVENAEEAEMFLSQDTPFEIGMRINIDEQLVRSFLEESRSGAGIDTRFGLYFDDMVEYAKKFNDSTHLKFVLFHYHMGGTIHEINKYIKFMNFLFEENYCVLKKFSNDLKYFDIGGGFPTQYNLDFDFDYKKLTDGIVSNIKRIADENKVPHPDIIGEHGRYTVADHSFFLYEISVVKKSNLNSYWYLINSSLMNYLPDSWALGQDFVILPLNLLNNKMVKVKLGGLTCDPDDTYYKQEKRNFLYLPEIKDGEKLYIGVFGVGAYQEMIAGVGGIHHCLIPEGNEVVIKNKNHKLEFNYINDVQSPEEVLDILDYNNSHNLIQYSNKYNVSIVEYDGPLDVYYNKLKDDFPEEEIFPLNIVEKAYKDKAYKIFLLYSNEVVVGYSFVLVLKNNKIAVLSYPAIFKEFRDKGYGHIMINQLKSYFSDYYGLLVEVQKPENNEVIDNKHRRIKFYEDLNFVKQDFNYEILETGLNSYEPMLLFVCNLKNRFDHKYKIGDMREILNEYFSILFGSEFEKQYKLSPIKEEISSITG